MRSVFTLLAFCCVSILHAQTEKTIANTCGETYTAGSIKLRISVGEPVVGMLSTTSGHLSQGFFNSRPPQNIIPVPVKGYSFYPNPFSNELMIQGDISKIKLVQLFDITGRLIMSAAVSDNVIDVKRLGSGVYTARLTGDNNTVVYYKKIVKQ